MCVHEGDCAHMCVSSSHGTNPLLVRVTLLFPCPHCLHKAANSRCFTNPGSFWAGRSRGALRARSHPTGPQASPWLPFKNAALTPLLSLRLVAMEVPPSAGAEPRGQEPGTRCPGSSIQAGLRPRLHHGPSPRPPRRPPSARLAGPPLPLLHICIPDSLSSTLLITSWQLFMYVIYLCVILPGSC